MLNILYLFHDFEEIMFKWQTYHIVDELKTHEVNIDIVGFEKYEDSKVLFKEISEACESNKYDLFMTCLGDKYIPISFLKGLKIKKLLFCPDNLVAPYNHRKISRYFDLVWLTSKETEYLFKRWGCKTIFLPYAANPNLFLPTEFEENEVERRVCFVGRPHGSRVRAINTLIHNCVPVTIYSAVSSNNRFFKASFFNYMASFVSFLKYKLGWKLALGAIIDKFRKEKIDVDSSYLKIEPPVELKNVATIYSKYALVLAFSEANSTGYLKKPVDIVNLRNFEIPMAGGIQFVRYTKELASYFTDGVDVCFYKNDKEMIEKAKAFLLIEHTKLSEIRNSARSNSLANHTWGNRFAILFRELGIAL